MARITNPFVVTGKIGKEYFCDRKDETEMLYAKLINGNNIVLISPRRMGKTGLVKYCYDYKFGKNRYTFFVDILHTTSLQEFTYLLGRKIYEAIMLRSKKMLISFLRTLKSISGQFGFDPVNNTPTFNLNLGDITRPELTLEEIFRYLENADKPCIVTIDEFQQIAKYPEKNVEALLRTYIQEMSNCQFVFAGSEYHIMQEMFISEAHPFYDSADILELKPINEEVYSNFVCYWMAKYSRSISSEIVSKVYRLFRGNTYGMQKTFNEMFLLTGQGDTCTLKITEQAINNVVDSKEPLFNELLSNIPEGYKALLYAIANEGQASQITSEAFITRHHLSSASAVQYAAKQLVSKGVVSKIHGKYSITEQFFDIWINRMYGDSPLWRMLE